MATPRFEFWFDLSCPYAYLASTQVEALAERTGAELDVRPFLLGGVFRAVGTAQNLAGTLIPSKALHNAFDMARWAQRFDVPLLVPPPKGHPFRTVDALREILAVGPPFLPLAHHYFRAYWVEGRDLSDAAVRRDVLRAAGHAPEPIQAKAGSDAIKQELRDRTDDALARGVFGAPAFFLPSERGGARQPAGELFWGQDRIDRVERLLGGTPAPLQPYDALTPGVQASHAPVDLFFDLSSPFGTLGLLSAREAFGPHLRLRPMLLGALFKAIGTPVVPLATLPKAKQAWSGRDFLASGAELGLDVRWPTRFPMRTVLSLRAILAARLPELGGSDEASEALACALGAAYWGQDQDIAAPEVVAQHAATVGLDGAAVLEAATRQDVKDQLRAETDAAREAGAFGAPTFVVHTPDGPELYWGVDRLALVAARARGEVGPVGLGP